MKLYKAVDNQDGKLSMFLVYDNGEVAVSSWGQCNNRGKERCARRSQGMYLREDAERFDDAIDPVLIAEW